MFFYLFNLRASMKSGPDRSSSNETSIIIVKVLNSPLTGQTIQSVSKPHSLSSWNSKSIPEANRHFRVIKLKNNAKQQPNQKEGCSLKTHFNSESPHIFSRAQTGVSDNSRNSICNGRKIIRTIGMWFLWLRNARNEDKISTNSIRNL